MVRQPAKPKRLTIMEQGRIEMERRQDIPPTELTAYCEACGEWYEYSVAPDSWDLNTCPTCGHQPSSRIGYQIHTQRTFNPFMKRKKIVIKSRGIIVE